jgi:hypothetical protein
MNICIIFNTNQNQSYVGFLAEIFHIQILVTRLIFISFEGEQRKVSSWALKLK